MIAGAVFAIAGVTAAVVTVAFMRSDVYRLAVALQEPDAWQRFHSPDHPVSGFPLESMTRTVVVAAVILAVGGVSLLIPGGGQWRLLLSGTAAGSAVYLLTMAQPWMAAALPGWITLVAAMLPILLGLLVVPLALVAAPHVGRARLRGSVATAVAVGGVIAALDWWRLHAPDGPIPPLTLLVYLLAQPLLLSAIVFACAFVAGVRRTTRAGLGYAVLGLALPLVAVAGEFLRITAAAMGTWYPTACSTPVPSSASCSR
jgi:hypothetical protein